MSKRPSILSHFWFNFHRRAWSGWFSSETVLRWICKIARSVYLESENWSISSQA